MVYEQNHIDLPTLEGVYKQLYAYGNYIDEVVYASCPGATYTMRRYLHDHLYSPAAIVYLTASNCILLERSEYDAYGAAHYYNADYSQTFAVSQHGNPFAFTGRETDSFDFASGVPQLTQMHYRHRDYSPQMGRFYQEDMYGVNPAGGMNNPFNVHKQYGDGVNIYEYVKSNPIQYLDPDGRSITSILHLYDWYTCGISIYCRNNTSGFAKGIDHCSVIVPGLGNEYPDMNADDAKLYPVSVDRSSGRIFGAGPGIGKPCACASCFDIRECIEKGKTRVGGWGGGLWGTCEWALGKNCQNAVAKTLRRCCLVSSWKPSAPIFEPYPLPHPPYVGY